MRKKFTLLFAAMLVAITSFAASAPQNLKNGPNRQNRSGNDETEAKTSVRSMARMPKFQIVLTESDFTEITLPYNENLVFDDVNSFDYNGMKIIPLKITFTEGKYLLFSGYNDDLNWGMCFDLFKDNLNNHVVSYGWFNDSFVYFSPGTYYLLLNDDGYYADYDTYYSSPVNIDIANLEEISYTSISLPYDETLEFSSANSVEIGDQRAIGLQFTLTDELTLCSFTGRNSEIDWDVNFILISPDGNSISKSWNNKAEFTLEPGTYKLLVTDAGYYSERQVDFACPVTIETAPFSFTIIDTMPYQETLEFAGEKSAEINGMKYLGWQITLTQSKFLSFNSNANIDWDAYFTLYSADGSMDESFRKRTGGVLPAGTYYLLTNDGGYSGEPALTLQLDIQPAVHYTAINYSTITSGMYTGKMDENTQYVFTPMLAAEGLGYNVPVEAGKRYTFIYKGYAPEVNVFGGVLTLLTGDELQGEGNEFYGDVINSSSNGGSGTEFEVEIEYLATENGFIRVLLQGVFENVDEIIYSLDIKSEALSYVTLPQLLQTAGSIPYSNELSFTVNGTFDAGQSALVSGDNSLGFRASDEFYYATAYKMNLSGGDSINVHHQQIDDAYLYIYQKTGENEYTCVISDDDGASNNNGSLIRFKVQEAGEFYIVATTYSPYDDDGTGAYYLTVWNTEEEPENSYPGVDATTFPELLAAATTLSYSDELAFSYAGEFADGKADLVAGDESLDFRKDGRYYYAVAYHINLSENDSINVYHSQVDDAYLYLYQKTEENVYTKVLSDDDGGENGDSQLIFKASEAGDYYIVATTYSSYLDGGRGVYELYIWNTPERPEVILPQIVSLSASQSSITVDLNATDVTIRTVLMRLGITGKGDDDATVDIANNPYAWTLSADRKSAVFEPKSAVPGYTYADGLSLTVNINMRTDCNDKTSGTVTVFTQNRNVYVAGAEIGSQLVVFDTMGRPYINTFIQSDNDEIRLQNSGIYIVRVGKEVFKVFCK